MAAVLGDDPTRLSNDVQTNDVASPLAAASPLRLNQREAWKKPRPHHQLHRRVEEIPLEKPHASPFAVVVFIHSPMLLQRTDVDEPSRGVHTPGVLGG